MRVGVLKEIKTKEHRVSMTPSGVEQMTAHGHEVMVETLTDQVFMMKTMSKLVL